MLRECRRQAVTLHYRQMTPPKPHIITKWQHGTWLKSHSTVSCRGTSLGVAPRSTRVVGPVCREWPRRVMGQARDGRA